jgi:hypothetical protein
MLHVTLILQGSEPKFPSIIQVFKFVQLIGNTRKRRGVANQRLFSASQFSSVMSIDYLPRQGAITCLYKKI